MNTETIKKELREIRNLNKRGISNETTQKYQMMFSKLPDLEQRVMVECYINGKSYALCGHKFAYCERQIYRLVGRSIELLVAISKEVSL